MSRAKQSILSLVLLLLASHLSSGQAAKSPFSAFGYGDYIGESLVNNQGMAGAGVSNPQFWFFNNQNPALTINNRLAVFQAGIIGENKRIYSDTLKGLTRNGNLNYLLLGFPAHRNKRTGVVNWAMGIGLMPYSNVNYGYEYSDSLAGAKVVYAEHASGGFNQFYWSNGLRITRDLSVGIKTALLFSSIISDYTNTVVLANQTNRFINTVHEVQEIKGFRFTPGVSYKIDSIKRKYALNFGATWEIKSDLSSESDQVLVRRDFQGAILSADTVTSLDGLVNFPNRITAGLSFGRSDKWVLASDLTLTNYEADVINTGFDKTSVKKGYRFAFGGEITPDARSLGSYLKRVTYRAGFSQEKGTYLVNGNAVNDFGINFGFSFPVNRISSLDLAFRAGQRGNEKLNGIEEKYFRIYFGVTFNDQWFIKRRFD